MTYFNRLVIFSESDSLAQIADHFLQTLDQPSVSSGTPKQVRRAPVRRGEIGLGEAFVRSARCAV